MLSGLIRCGACGSNYVIDGKTYYRCAGYKERRTCADQPVVAKEALEGAVLSALERDLLTEENARIFVDEFRREAKRLAATRDDRREQAARRLAEVEQEIANLTANMLAGVIGPTLQNALAAREEERTELVAAMGATAGGKDG